MPPKENDATKEPKEPKEPESSTDLHTEESGTSNESEPSETDKKSLITSFPLWLFSTNRRKGTVQVSCRSETERSSRECSSPTGVERSKGEGIPTS